ncbi:MAG: winged helix-turn-helix domain-containing protein [Acidimicrobiales bacterium]
MTERNGQTLFEVCSRLAIWHQLGSSRQAISQHLDVLESAGLIETKRRGRYKFHYIKTESTTSSVSSNGSAGSP